MNFDPGSVFTSLNVSGTCMPPQNARENLKNFFFYFLFQLSSRAKVNHSNSVNKYFCRIKEK